MMVKNTGNPRIVMILLLLFLTLSGMMPVLAEDTAGQKLNTFYSLAVGYISRQEYDKGMQYLDSALELCSEQDNEELYAVLHLKKGCIYTIQGEYEEALKELDEAIRVLPDMSETWLVEYQVYSETDNTTGAIESLEKYIDLTGDQSMYERLAELYLQNGDREKAENSFRHLAEASVSDDMDASYNLAVYEMGAGMYEEALVNLKKCDADTEKYPGLFYNTGVCEMMVGNYDEAAKTLTISIDKEQFQTDAVYNRAICYMSLQDMQSAMDDFTNYIDLLALAESGEEQQSEEGIPDMAWYYRGVCAISCSLYEQAAADFTTCIENGINENESLFNRGLSYLKDGRYEESKADFTACVEKAFLPDDALFYRSYTERYLNDYEAALADLTVCIEHEYNPGQTYQQRAQVYLALNDEDHYLMDLEASLEYLNE